MSRRFIYIITICIFSTSFSFSQTDSHITVTAKKGDGIYKILRDNGYSNKYYNTFIELNKDKINSKGEIILGETYILPKLKTNNNLQYAKSLKSTELNGSVFYLISGHGGPDPGAITKVNKKMLSEDEYAYDICLRLAVRLEEQGAKVFMIINDPNDSIRNEQYLDIDYDEYCYPKEEIPLNQKERLLQRAKAVNDLHKKNKDIKYHRAISIHIDSRSTSAKTDVFFYYFPRSKKGKNAALSIRSVFDAKYAKHQPDRGYNGTVSSRDLLVMRETNPPIVFIELGNIQNSRDQKRFFSHNNRQALANWIAEGLANDFIKNK